MALIWILPKFRLKVRHMYIKIIELLQYAFIRKCDVIGF